MSDTPQKPITPQASDVFGEALISLVQWKGGSEEPTVMLGRRGLEAMKFEAAKRALPVAPDA
jgi:hypothetical protein